MNKWWILVHWIMCVLPSFLLLYFLPWGEKTGHDREREREKDRKREELLTGLECLPYSIHLKKTQKCFSVTCQGFQDMTTGFQLAFGQKKQTLDKWFFLIQLNLFLLKLSRCWKHYQVSFGLEATKKYFNHYLLLEYS